MCARSIRARWRRARVRAGAWPTRRQCRCRPAAGPGQRAGSCAAPEVAAPCGTGAPGRRRRDKPARARRVRAGRSHCRGTRGVGIRASCLDLPQRRDLAAAGRPHGHAHHLLQRVARTGQARQHGARRDLQRLGHLRSRHVVEIEQHQHFAVNGRQPCECLDDIELVVQAGVRRGLLGLLFIVQRLHAGHRLAEGGAAHDLEQPGPCQRPIPQLLAVFPCVGKTVLHHVFGDRARAGQRPGAAKQKAVVVPHPGVVAGLGRLQEHGDQERPALLFIPRPS
mmetsp:Transcript_21759/g.85040  ORF Transcript_21759/g.85040 Transcript_21759/m.85040 type:complete len:280 (+) Transcript_21759:438-1277(+)